MAFSVIFNPQQQEVFLMKVGYSTNLKWCTEAGLVIFELNLTFIKTIYKHSQKSKQ